MPSNVTYDQLESGWCRYFWKRGRLTWTQAKKLKKGDWLLLYGPSANNSLVRTDKRWILAKVHGLTTHVGSNAIFMNRYPEDMSNISPYHMSDLKLPSKKDLEGIANWGIPLTVAYKENAEKHGEVLIPEKQISLF